MDAKSSAGVPLSSPTAAQRCAEGAGLDSGAPAAAQSAMLSIALPATAPIADHLSTNAAAPAAPQLQSRISTSLTDVTRLGLPAVGLRSSVRRCIMAASAAQRRTGPSRPHSATAKFDPKPPFPDTPIAPRRCRNMPRFCVVRERLIWTTGFGRTICSGGLSSHFSAPFLTQRSPLTRSNRRCR